MAFPVARMLLLISLLLQAPGTRQTQGGSVKGLLLTSAGTPLEGIRVAVEPADSGAGTNVLESIGLTEKDGRFLLEGITPGRYHLVFGQINSPFYHPGVSKRADAATIAVVVGQVTDVPQVVVKTTRVSGRVVDLKTQRGRSVQSLLLCCEADSIGYLRSAAAHAAAPTRAMVGEDGNFTFGAILPGDYFLQVLDPEVVPVAQTISVGRDDLTSVELGVTSGVAVNGQIVDGLRQVVPSVNVTLTPHPSNPLRQSKSVPLQGVSAVLGNTSSAVSTLPAGWWNRGDVMLPVFKIVGNAIHDQPQRTTATPEGTFAFSGVLPGKYTLEMNAPGGNGFSREVEAGIHEPLNITMEVPFSQLTGRIVHDDGSPLPKLTGSVRFVSMDPNSRILYGFPDSTGRFSVMMASGEYRIFTDTLNVDRDIESISDGSSELKERRFVFDESRPQEIRITVTP